MFGCVSILGTPSRYREEGAAFVGKHTRYLRTGCEGYTRDLVVVRVEEDAARWSAVTPRTAPLLRHGRGRARARVRVRVWARVRVRVRVRVRGRREGGELWRHHRGEDARLGSGARLVRARVRVRARARARVGVRVRDRVRAR